VGRAAQPAPAPDPALHTKHGGGGARGDPGRCPGASACPWPTLDTRCPSPTAHNRGEGDGVTPAHQDLDLTRDTQGRCRRTWALHPLSKFRWRFRTFPWRPPISSHSGRVLPRTCGDESPSLKGQFLYSGPSLRLRGRGGCVGVITSGMGAIPASAGTMRHRSSCCYPRRVHPRVCGDDSSPGTVTTSGAGPSPRLRGRYFLTCAFTGEDGP